MPDPAHIVLLRPRRALNLGGVARAMKNFGLQRLTLVDSEIGSWSDAFRMAVQANDVLHGARQTDDLDAVVADATFVVGTSNRPRPGQRLLSPREVAAEAQRQRSVVLLFGDEINGLSNDELLRCHAVSAIPTAPEQPSLNLAQAVLVYAYELFLARDSGPVPAPSRAEPADEALLQLLTQKLRATLGASAWADADREPSAIAELVQPLRRALPTRSEVLLWLTALGKIVQPLRRNG